MNEDEKERLNEVYAVFVRWYAMPQGTREPKTIEDFCRHMDIPLSAIAGFQARDTFTDDLYRQAIQWGKSKVPELLHLLYDKYKMGKSPNDLRMYKELINLDKGDAKKEQDNNTTKGILRELFEASR